MEERTRKILIRVVGAPLLLAALAGLLYLDYARESAICLRFLIAAVCALGAWEFYALCRRKGHETAWLIGLGAVAIPALPWAQLQQWIGLQGKEAFAQAASYISNFPLGVFVLLLYLLCKLVFRWGRFTVEGAALTLTGCVYVGLLHFAYPPNTPAPAGSKTTWYLIFMIATNKGSDMAAFVVGKLLGRHKMTPVLSPNKTWEGAIAGGVVGTAAGFFAIWCSPLKAAYHALPSAYLLLFALLVTIASQVGDLAESAFKRWAGVKDSGGLLPEFGGILDMADSFILSLPVAFLLSELLLRIFR